MGATSPLSRLFPGLLVSPPDDGGPPAPRLRRVGLHADRDPLRRTRPHRSVRRRLSQLSGQGRDVAAAPSAPALEADAEAKRRTGVVVAGSNVPRLATIEEIASEP